MPSVLYKVRLLVYRETLETKGGATIRRVKNSLNES
jgi:hypothetical protein